MSAPTSGPAGSGRAAPPQQRARKSVRESVRAAAALTLLLAVVLGMPAALIALSQALHPLGTLRAADLLGALSRPDDGSLLLAALFLIGWLTWLVFTLSVAVEIVALTRGVATPRLPGLQVAQQGAAALVATAALLCSGPAFLAEPVALAAPVAALDLPRGGAELRSALVPPAADRNVHPVTEPAGEYPTVGVRRHDTLWSLAQTYLGAGERFPEIVALNLGRQQRDGRALDDTGWVYPGWTLRLPAGAQVAARVGNQVANPVANPVEPYTVHPGDTLSGIAEHELGDDRRYVEVFDLNRGHRQADGSTLADPDAIRAGWHLQMPPGPAHRPDAALPPVRRLAGDKRVPPAPQDSATAAPMTPAPTTPSPAGRAPALTGTGDDAVPVQALTLGLGSVVASNCSGPSRRGSLILT